MRYLLLTESLSNFRVSRRITYNHKLQETYVTFCDIGSSKLAIYLTSGKAMNFPFLSACSKPLKPETNAAM